MMMEHFHILPSQLDEEDADEMLRNWRLLGLYHEYESKRKVR